MKRDFIKIVLVVTALLLTQIGCAPQKSNNTYDVALQFGSYSTVKNNWLKLFLPEAKASVSNLKMCFKRLRFKIAEEESSLEVETDEDNIDFELGEVDISSGATSLGVITLPEGDYRRVEFDLENDCASGKSIQLSNSHGSFSSNERITIKFEGQFTANADGTLTLGVQQILDQLNNYNGSGSLKNAAQAVSGELAQ